MKFKIDENLPGELVADLRELGHDAETVFDEQLSGAKDPILKEAGLVGLSNPVPWLGNRPVLLDLP